MSVQPPLPAYSGYLRKTIYTGALALALAGQAQAANNCGYQVDSGTYATWTGGYQAWVEIGNQSGETATSFEVLLDTGGTAITDGSLAKYQPTEGGGYLASEPDWLQWQAIPQGSSYRFHFNGEPDYAGMTPYLTAVNGKPCDREAPEVTLSTSARYFTAAGTLTLDAEAADNTAVRKVVFARDGEVIAEDWDAPYQLELAIDDTDNGRHFYTATAYDPSGNKADSEQSRLLVAIGNKFFGTASDGEPDHLRLAYYFDQLTPGNAGKWASVEGNRDQMNWQNLDTAYQFARDHDLHFKQHTLIWGQQQPGWLSDQPPQRQLTEIDQWMAALAERYPDLEMIDVVNEPLHAQPAYKAALGGDGETGWDWLINAFALARAHFPNAELILNDYNILILGQFTQDYLAVIEQLQSRGLIDGIGLQAHFLERAELPVVQANLDALAATGLPVYISELELNFADDARQANAMRDLFSIFWEHPAVVGVTHWGYLENRMWRENGYLLRADGSERPALQWLTCYMAGGDCDHLVPEYIPAGWSGGEYGLTLEAELYDEGQGLIASGNQVAFTDNGDWIAFRGVEFQQGWDTFQVHYAKGNEAMGSISIHLDDLSSEPVLTLPLEPTASWGSFSTLETPWAPIAGTRDVYVRFNDTWGVANIDWLRIGKAGAPEQDVNLVTNGDFEQNAAGWSAGWGGGDIATSTAQAKVGSHSLIASGFGSGAYAAYSLDVSAPTPGDSYPVSAWVWISGASAGQVTLTRKLACEGQSDSYSWLANNGSVEPQTWTQLQGELAIPANCTPTEVLIYFENTAAGTDVHIDGVEVIAPAEPGDILVPDGGFEGAGLADGWSAWWAGGTSLALTTEQFHGGAQSMKVSERTANSNPSIDLTSKVAPGSSYDVSAWVRHTGADAARVTLTHKLACEGQDDSYSAVADNTGIPANEWTQLSGSLEIPADCTVNEARLYFENTPLEIETLYLDDVSVTAM